MKILHVIGNLAPEAGGPAQACLQMAEAVAALGHEVSIYATDKGDKGGGKGGKTTIRKEDSKGVNLRCFPMQSPRFFHYSAPLGGALKRDIPGFDVVHVHSLYLYHGMIAGHYCRKYGVPYIVRPHGTLDPFLYRRHRARKWIAERLFEQKNLSEASLIHFVSEEEARLAEPYIYGAKGAVVPLGIRVDEYLASPGEGLFRKAFPEVKDRKIVLFFGRISFKKGLDLLVEAFAQLAMKRRDVHLVLAGPDSDGYEELVRGWIESRSLQHCTTFTGLLQGAMKLAVLQEAAAFVLPSRTENFGIAVVEAMASGCPVIISEAVNIWPAIKESGSGAVIALRPDALHDAMAEMLSDERKMKEMGARGRDFVAKHYDWRTVAPKLEAMYRSVAK